jgi:L-asparaginase II
MLTGVPLVAVTRGPRVESIHNVAACATDVRGNVVLSLGTIDEPFYLRSSAKPFIAAAAVLAGAADRYAFGARELAIMAASHGGEPFHIVAVQSILAKIGATVDDLECGVHPPSCEPAAIALAASGEKPTALHNNCSGKHAGILALCRMLDVPFAGYLEAGHPAQRAILAMCERVSDDTFGPDRLGIDGCGIPVYATSLRDAARSFARFATLEELDDADAAALLRVRTAMIAEPAYVAGTGRFDSDLMRVAAGAIACKAGAEGVHADAMLGSGLGLVLKVTDGGARRAIAPAAMVLLQQMGALDGVQASALAGHARTPLKNVAGRTVGEIGPLEQPTRG